MVSTRACKMDSEKKNGVNNIGSEKSNMKTENKLANCSNPESEEDEQNSHGNGSTSGLPRSVGGSSIKVTIKKTRSCSSTSSRESAQSFKVVRSVQPAAENISEEEEEEDDENAKDSDNEKTSDKQSDKHSDENDKDSDEEGSQNTNITDDDDIEILSSDDDSTEKDNPTTNYVSVKEENKLSLVNTVVDLKTEDPTNQNLTTVKNEDCKIKVKSLKEELIRESQSDGEIVLKEDVNNSSDEPQQLSAQSQNGTQKKEDDTKGTIKEQKYKLNVRSFDDLVAPRPAVALMNSGYSLIDGQPNFLTQNGSTSFPPSFMNLPCDVCGIQFDSPDLLNDHKTAMKHFKCSFKECEHLVYNNQQEFLDHQRLVHNIMPSPVQQLAHQVQRLPAMGFDQQLQSGVPPLSENLPPPSGVPNLYTQSLRMPSQPVPMQRPMRPMMRSNMPQHLMSSRGRGVVTRASRGRPMSLNTNMMRGTMKRPSSSMSIRQTPPMKRLATDRNSYSNNMNKTPQIVKSISESLTKSANKTASPSQQDVVNLFSKRGLTISTVDTVNNISLPAGLSLNSAVSIIPTSPQKVSNNLPSKVSSSASNKNLDTVDLTGPDRPRAPTKYYPCEICSKTYLSVEAMYEHVHSAHKAVSLPFKCNLCTGHFPNAEVLHRHKISVHKAEMNSSIPFGIPIIDFTKPGTSQRLQSMGITNYLPVAQLDNQGGHYGVPIMNVGRSGSLDGLKYTNFFNLGCIRKI